MLGEIGPLLMLAHANWLLELVLGDHSHVGALFWPLIAPYIGLYDMGCDDRGMS